MQDHDSTIFRPAGGGSLMGVKLFVEVMDHWRDFGLTKGERDDLLVIAENANDGSRETFGSIHEDYILRRADKKAQSWRNALDALKRKGVLEYAIRDGRQLAGRPGQHAVYRIPVLCPEPPHDGYKGQCTRNKSAAERVIPQSTHSWVTQESTHMGTPAEYPSNRLGTPGGAECVLPGSTPTPPNPSGKNSPQTTPSHGAVHPDWLAPESEGAGVQREGEGWEAQDGAEAASPVVDSVADDPLTYQAVLFVDKLPFDQRPTSSERAQLAYLAGLWFAEGWTHEALMAKCESNLGDVRNRINVWINHRLAKHRVTKPPKVLEGGHQTYQDPAASAYGPPKREHVGWQNPTDPDAYEGTF